MDIQEQPDKELELLLNIVTSDNTEVKPQNEAELFVAALGIKAGNTKIINPQIWYVYNKWTDKPIIRDTFFKQFKKLFKFGRNESYRYFYLDPTPFDLSKEEYFRVKAFLRQEKKKRAYKKKVQETWKKKRSGQISGSNEER